MTHYGFLCPYSFAHQQGFLGGMSAMDLFVDRQIKKGDVEKLVRKMDSVK